MTLQVAGTVYVVRDAAHPLRREPAARPGRQAQAP